MLDETGRITGYKTSVGADTVFPFSGCDYVITTTNTDNNNGEFTFPDDYNKCFLVLSIFRCGSDLTLSNPALSNNSGSFEELYSDSRKNTKNTSASVIQRTIVYRFTNVKKGDVFSYKYTDRCEAHVSLFA